MDGPPLMVSRNTMPKKRLPRAVVPWVLDSGGFTELSLYGGWRMGATEYVDLVRRYRDEVGMLQWAAPQDWMCEPWILHKTGRPLLHHQALTLANLLTLRGLAPDLPFIPVLQGWALQDYLDHADDYALNGIDLAAEVVVGVGSVCRRQGTDEAVAILRALHERGIRCHGFGLKAKGIARAWPYLASADSLAWSYAARYQPSCGRDNGRGGAVKTCANCRHAALEWYGRASTWTRPIQQQMEVAA